MRRIVAWVARFSGLFFNVRRDREFLDEIEAHLQMHIEDNIRRGMTNREAHREAMMKLGGMNTLTEQYRERSGVPSMEKTIQDFLYGARALTKTPGITATALLTLALGIGATTGIFSVVYTVLLKGLPFPQPERLVQLWESRVQKGWHQSSFTLANFWDVRARNRTFEEVGALGYSTANLTGYGEPRAVSLGSASAGFFAALGVKPVLGRIFVNGDDQPGHDSQIALLQYRFWRIHLGGSAQVVGQSIQLDGKPFVIVGVLLQGEPWLNEADVFVPLVYNANANRGSFEYAVVGRMKESVTIDAARSDLESVCNGLAAEFPGPDKGMGIKIQPASSWVASDELRRTLWVLLGAVGFLLLIACINLTNLLLVRATGRSREVALRLALGATRGRVVRMILSESLLLGLGGGMLGLLLAVVMVRGLTAIDPDSIPRIREIGLNLWVLAFTFGIALVTGMLAGLAPALQSGHRDLTASLREGDRGQTGSRTQNRVRSALIAVEVGLSLILLIGAGLMIRSFGRLLDVDRGFQSDNRLVFSVNLPASFDEPKADQIIDGFLTRASSSSQVVSAAAVSSRPLIGWDPGMGIGAADHVDAAGSAVPWAGWRFVTPDYFRTIGVPLLSGRGFDRADTMKSRRVVVSKRLADLLWPGQDPIGRQMLLWKGQGGPTAEVIGVVGDQHERGLDVAPTLTVYLPYNGTGFSPITFLIHTSGDPMRVLPSLRSMLAGIDPNLPVSDVQTLDEVVNRSLAPRWFNTLLLATFAGLALLLSIAGIYGTLSYSVARRTSEIGLRAALGANRRNLLSQVIVQGMRPVIVGFVTGMVGAAAVSRLLEGMLFEIRPRDSLTYLIVVLVALAVALASCYVPARRALRVDPVVALRCE